MKHEKRRCIQAVRKTKLISFFALYFARYSILCNIIKGSIHLRIEKERERYTYIYIYIYVCVCTICIYSFFSLRSGASNVIWNIRCILKWRACAHDCQNYHLYVNFCMDSWLAQYLKYRLIYRRRLYIVDKTFIWLFKYMNNLPISF